MVSRRCHRESGQGEIERARERRRNRSGKFGNGRKEQWKQVQVAAEEVQTVYDSAHAAHCLALSMNRSSQLSLRSGPVRGG